MDDPLLERLRRALAPDIDVAQFHASGGMGDVYTGREVALNRRVAIKVLRPGLETARAVERFVREAQTLAAFHHPHIVAVHRVFPDADGLACYTMDFLEGETLAARLARGVLTPGATVRLGRELLAALEVAHRRGIVHRDIKPSNIVLEEHGAVLTDFGIAKTLSDERPALTGPGDNPGTLVYMPPEQAAGAEITPRTDLYALAMVLYEALTGRPWSILDRPESADWTDVPRRLAHTLRKALAWAPEDRWPDAAAFRRALWAPRTTPVVPVAGAAVLAIIAFLVWPRSHPTRPPLPDLAITSFSISGGTDPSLGEDLASVVWMNLEPFPRIRLAPEQSIRAEGPAPHAVHHAAGDLTVHGDSLTVRLVVQDSLGTPIGGDRLRGTIAGKWDLGSRIAFRLVQILRPDLATTYGAVPPPTRSIEALDEFLDGVEAFRDDRWRQAEIHLTRATTLDTGFALARWRLWNVQLWRRIPRTVDLPWLLRHPQQLSDVDQRLVAAEMAPPGARRLRAYEDALARYPGDDYAALLYASELFHRGPLVGIGLDSSVVILQALAARPEAFAPAHDQLVWALIRLGRRAAADSALRRLTAAAKPERDIDPVELQLAYQARFSSAAVAATVHHAPPAMLAELLKRTRLGLSFDVPETERLLGSLLAAAPGEPAARRADGHEAMGLALVAEGRPAAALAHFDSAAALFDSPGARLQAAQWRVLPKALGLPGPPAGDVAAGRRDLADLALGGPVAGRAAWTLAFDALAAGHTDADRWRTRLESLAAADSGGGLRRLVVLLQGVARGRAGDDAGALRETAPLDSLEDWRGLGDPFDRAVLHLLRAQWQDALRLREAAESTRRWQQNSDFDGWLNGEAQAAEIDWTLGMSARLRLAIDAIHRGDVTGGCPALRRVRDLWSEAEAGYAPFVAQANEALRSCPG